MVSYADSDEALLVKLNSEASVCGKKICCQHASKIIDYSSEYGNTNNVSYVAENIIGPPNVFPRVGDSSSCFQLRTYGKWWEELPSSLYSSCILPAGVHAESQDFIEFEVGISVLPRVLRIYEVYNPGAIIKILCFCKEQKRWFSLWHGKTQYLDDTKSHCFEVVFKPLGFMSNHYRIEFHHRHLNYFTEIDSISLFGEHKFSSNPQAVCLSSANHVSDTKHTLNISICNHVFDKENSYFHLLPDEVLQLIMSHLDLQSLCRCSNVCKLFKRICYDPILYQNLNLKLYWHKVNDFTFSCLHTRLSALKKLNASWCGGQDRFQSQTFAKFMELDCNILIRLQLSNCPFLNDDCMKTIASTCVLLQELELRSCNLKEGYKHISTMRTLKHLDLYNSNIDKYSLMNIIKCIKLEHLNLGSCRLITDFNEVAIAVGLFLGNCIKSLDLWRAPTLGCAGILAIAAGCPNLVELDISWCHRVDPECGCICSLINNCRKLQKLFLAAMRSLSNDELNIIAKNCPNIQQLDLLGTRLITSPAVKNLLQSCPKLKLLDLSFTTLGSNIAKFQRNFPNVQIKNALDLG